MGGGGSEKEECVKEVIGCALATGRERGVRLGWFGDRKRVELKSLTIITVT